MEVAEGASPMEAGRGAVQRGDWATARRHFEKALALHPHSAAQAHLGLGTALWWLGEFGASLDQRRMAYAAFLRSGERMAAAAVAVWLSIAYDAGYGNRAAAAGWVARAGRLSRGPEVGGLAGWVQLARATHDLDPVRSERLANEAFGIARAHGDHDLELCALSEVGRAQITLGKVTEGMKRIDEAIAGSLGGEWVDPTTVVFTCCHMLQGCAATADLVRATQWCKAVEPFIRQYGCPYLFAYCRARYGEVLFSVGRWDEAEQELVEAMHASEHEYRRVHAESAATLAELRVHQGRVEEGVRLLEGFEAEPCTARAQAWTRLARGELEAAAWALKQRLGQLTPDALEGPALLELLVRVHVLAAESMGAREAADRLDAMVTLTNRRTDLARAHLAAGRVAAATGDAEKAQQRLQAALEAFSALEMPFEQGCARLELARAVAGERRAAAVIEAVAALAVFERLGAKQQADVAAALLRSLGGRRPMGPRGDAGALTRREREVVPLLGLGLSNAEIAGRLCISRKTVEHHVSRVLSKLRLRSRAEAAAYAARPERSAGAHRSEK